MKSFKQIFSLFNPDPEEEKRERMNVAMDDADKFVHVADMDGVPYVFIQDIPVLEVVSDPSSLQNKFINIDDVYTFISEIRDKYVEIHKDDELRVKASR